MAHGPSNIAGAPLTKFAGTPGGCYSEELGLSVTPLDSLPLRWDTEGGITPWGGITFAIADASMEVGSPHLNSKEGVTQNHCSVGTDGGVHVTSSGLGLKLERRRFIKVCTENESTHWIYLRFPRRQPLTPGVGLQEWQV